MDANALAIEENKNRKKKLLLVEFNVISGGGNGKKHVNCPRLGQLLMKKHNYYFITIDDETTNKQEIFYYQNGMYHNNGENKIKQLVTHYIGDMTTIHRKNEVVDYIKYQNCVSRNEFESPKNLINLINGVYDINTDKLNKHSPEYHFINQLPIKYDKDADCPNIKKFVSEVLFKDEIPLLQEMFGFCLYREYFLRAAFLMYGYGANGKGVTIDLLAYFLGKKNYSARKLHSLIEDKFAKASLYGKLANLGAEVSGKALIDTGDFKNLTGGEPITGERKFMGDFSFHNYAKLIFNANHIPYSKYDKSDAFFKRWQIIVFPNIFEMGDPKTKQRNALLKELTTPEELSGLFNWAVEGLQRLLKKNRFTRVGTEKDEEERYELLARPEKRFLVEYLELAEGSNVETDDVYTKYHSWASDRRYPIQSKSAFTKSVKRTFRGCEVVQLRPSMKRFYMHVFWKSTVDSSFIPHSPNMTL